MLNENVEWESAVEDDAAPFAIAVAAGFSGAAGPECVDNLIAFAFTDTGEDEALFRDAPEGGCRGNQNGCENVGADDIGGSVPSGILKDIGLEEPDPFVLKSVEGGVLPALGHADRVGIEGFNLGHTEFGGGDGENTAAGAGIENGARLKGIAGAFEFLEAKARGEVIARAKAEAGIDPQVDAVLIGGGLPDGNGAQVLPDILNMKMVPPKGGPLFCVTGQGLYGGEGDVMRQLVSMSLGEDFSVEIEIDHGLAAAGLFQTDGLDGPVRADPLAEQAVCLKRSRKSTLGTQNGEVRRFAVARDGMAPYTDGNLGRCA